MEIKTIYYAPFTHGDIPIPVTIRDRQILPNRKGDEHIFTEPYVVSSKTDYTIDWYEKKIIFSMTTQYGTHNHSVSIKLTWWQTVKLKWFWGKYLIQEEIFWTWVKRIGIVVGGIGTIIVAIRQYL